MFLDSTYFMGELYLPCLELNPNVVGVASRIQTVNENSLDWYIEKYEYEFLVYLLGYDLSRAYLQNIKEANFFDFKLSITFTDDKWPFIYNLVYTQRGNYKFSPAANYVYYYLCRWSRSQLSGKGEIRAEVYESLVATDADKLVKIWNEMCREVHYIRCKIKDNWKDYKDIGSCNCLFSYPFLPINSFNI